MRHARHPLARCPKAISQASSTRPACVAEAQRPDGASGCYVLIAHAAGTITTGLSIKNLNTQRLFSTPVERTEKSERSSVRSVCSASLHGENSDEPTKNL